jgi:hypothetical protein
MASGRHESRHYYDDDNDDGFYFGLSVGELIYKEEGLNTINPTVALFRFGKQFNPFVAIEGRIGTGVSDDESDGFRVDTRAIYGGYLKGMLPLAPTFSIYGLAGVSGVDLERNYYKHRSSDSGLSFGAGADWELGGGAALNLEWMRLIDSENDGYDYTADQLTFGVNWRF